MHLGPYPSERLRRTSRRPDFSSVPAKKPLSFDRRDQPDSIVNAMADHQAMLDAIRVGDSAISRSEVPSSRQQRSNHLKAFGYFCDASMVGIGSLPAEAVLASPYQNPSIDRLVEELRTKQTKTLAAGIDAILADLRESIDAPPATIDGHTNVLVFLYEYQRDPDPAEPGVDWIIDAQAHRACLLASETAVVIANYIRLLGWQARAHTGSSSDIDLHVATVAAGLATAEGRSVINPYLGDRFGVCAVTTDMELNRDRPLASMAQQPFWRTRGPAWWLGLHSAKGALNHQPFAKRRFVDGLHPFEKIARVEEPTTFIDEANVARVPKRADMFARAQFGDMGPKNETAAKNGFFAMKAAPARAQRRALGALSLLQDGDAIDPPLAPTHDPRRNHENIKAASYFLGVDAVGLSRCPEWTWYSHDASGEPISPTHDQAVSMIIDQGFETTDGSSGDDWISVAQSMRAYLRFATIGGVIAGQIRNLGFEAKAHTSMDGEVLQPPLLLLAGLGEVSRIGEVILNPYLGPRLKSGVVTTTMPVAHDKPIDFGLQTFCQNCNKCARECPAGAITAGPKLMFNGYEIYKSDSQRCMTYRLTNAAGAMCGRCMKTCPWNLEGLFAEAPFRWLAIKAPTAAKFLASLDDRLGRGGLNPTKKWWWDMALDPQEGTYRPVPVELVNKRDLQPDLDLRAEDQTLAVYPADLAPPPWPFPFPMDREKGIEAHQALVTAKQYKAAIRRGEAGDVVHEYTIEGHAPVVRVAITAVEQMTDSISKYEMATLDGSLLPEWTAGAHLDIVVAPGFVRQYSMSGDPNDRSKYQIGVLREDGGRGGSQLLHRIFSPGRKIFISEPINHFPLDHDAPMTYLMGGGIGVTPMIAMAHEAHALGMPFEFHYSISSRSNGGYLTDLNAAPWADRVHLHISDEGGRCDLASTLKPGASSGAHVYVCGPDRFMTATMDAAEALGYPEEARHLEYFSVPELPEYEDHDFVLRLRTTGIDVEVPADTRATDALAEAGVSVDVKCSDGICGVCKVGVIAGAVEHRDFVLSKKQQETAVILCRSRAADANGVVEIDL